MKVFKLPRPFYYYLPLYFFLSGNNRRAICYRKEFIKTYIQGSQINEDRCYADWMLLETT